MKFKYLLLFTSFYHVISFSQSDTLQVKAYVAVDNYEIDPVSIKKIEHTEINQFQGSYHFGESEHESSLEILYSNGKLFARNIYNEWNNETWEQKIFREHITSINDKIKVNKTIYELYSCIKKQEFLLHERDVGLVSNYYDTGGKISYHYIQFNHKSDKTFKGRFPEVSFVKLTNKDIGLASKYDLRIMRNEIFARRGHQFIKGRAMDKYFNTQKWYKSIKEIKEVDLNAIEKHNINLIKKLESKV